MERCYQQSEYNFFLYPLLSNMAENNMTWKSKHIFICKHPDIKKCWHCKNWISKKKTEFWFNPMHILGKIKEIGWVIKELQKSYKELSNKIYHFASPRLVSVNKHMLTKFRKIRCSKNYEEIWIFERHSDEAVSCRANACYLL